MMPLRLKKDRIDTRSREHSREAMHIMLRTGNENVQYRLTSSIPPNMPILFQMLVIAEKRSG